MNRLCNSIPMCDEQLAQQLNRMESSIIAFSRFTSIPVTFFSVGYEILWEFNKNAKFCITNSSYENPCSTCRVALAKFMENSLQTGEILTFVCTTGLINMCYALQHNGKTVGYFIAGPVAMGKNKPLAISEFYEKVSKEKIDIPLLMTMTNNLNVYTPDNVEHLSKIFLDILNSSYSSDRKISMNQRPNVSHANMIQAPLPVIQYPGDSSVIYNSLVYIREHYRTVSQLSEISDYVRVNKSYFSTLFKKEMGISIVDYFNNIRLEAALWELENTNKNITEIALSVGYHESSYFSKLFKKHYGVSPRTYRKRLF